MTLSNRRRQDAAWHESMARHYRSQAQLLLERYGDQHSAGALLYESAKQCINAVANRQGENPVSTSAKLRFLYTVSESNAEVPDLISNWQAATRLHIHADRGHLNQERFDESWESSQTFINQALSIYLDGP